MANTIPEIAVLKATIEDGEKIADLFEAECNRVAAESNLDPGRFRTFILGILTRRNTERRSTP